MKASADRIMKMAGEIITRRPAVSVLIIILINFIIRIFVFYNTLLFSFADYAAYLDAVRKIHDGEKVYLLNGNFLFAISYLGYFAEKISGSRELFFIFNCAAGSAATLVVYILVKKITGSIPAGLITLVILTLYTEFMVFSSVFYTPVIMILLVSLILLVIRQYINEEKRGGIIISGLLATLLFLITFFFKPELKYFPWFMLAAALFPIKEMQGVRKKVIILSAAMLLSYFLFDLSGVISRPEGNVISNSFVFFGHTGYGGDGGEGAFVYPENEAQYDSALAVWCRENNIGNPSAADINKFQVEEMRRFITGHPAKWIILQFRKFFRTFGVVPESTSFRVLYTGLLGGRLRLTAMVTVIPVVLIILMFIIFFPAAGSDKLRRVMQEPFIFIYLILFVYYIIATIFYGQYQERYRMPVMVLFIIPAIGYFIYGFKRKEFVNCKAVIIKALVITLFSLMWIFQGISVSRGWERYEKKIAEPYGKAKSELPASGIDKLNRQW